MNKVLPGIGAVTGFVLLLALVAHANIFLLVQTVRFAGYDLLLLIPYRTLFFLLYAMGWLLLLRPSDPLRRAPLSYLFWVATVREAVDRLLPVASVGGGVVGVRLVRLKAIEVAAVSASVIVEIILTVVAAYFFTALGLVLLTRFGTGAEYRQVLYVFVATLPVPILSVALLHHGSVFERLHAVLPRLLGERISPTVVVAVDAELRAALKRWSSLATVLSLQVAALISSSFEIWFALRLFGHSIDLSAAVVLESMSQALRHIAFMVPGGLGVQEAGLVLFGRVLGIDSEMALAVSMAKRLRELAWGLPALLSWQWAEARRFRQRSA